MNPKVIFIFGSSVLGKLYVYVNRLNVISYAVTGAIKEGGY